MRIIHVARFDGMGGAYAAYRLHRELLRLGHDSKMLVPEKRVEDPAVELAPVSRALANRLRRRLRQDQLRHAFAPYRMARPSGFDNFSGDRSIHGGDLLHHLFAADIVNVHSLHAPGGFAEFEAFFRVVPRHVPVVRTMHDMNFFTGGCHYAEGCTKYTHRCGACPELRSTHDDDLSRQIWRRKHHALGSVPTNRVHLVAPSQWLAAEARRSSLAARFPSTVIPYGLDLDVFRPRDRDAARHVLGLSPDARVLLFIAEPISRRFKGFTLLANALAGLPDRHTLMLIAVGSGRAPITPDLPFLHLGWVGNDRLLSMIYSAADLFVIPSSMENFAQTAVQALACGTPIIGSDVGGIPEIVRPGITGLLAPPRDATALGAAITALLNDPERRRQMAENCRQIALAEYSVELYAKRSIELYQTVIAQHGSIENNVLHKTPTVALKPIAAKIVGWLFGVEW